MHTHPLTVSPFFFFVSEHCVRSRCFLCPDCVCRWRGFVPTSGAAVSHKSAPSFSRYIDGGLSLSVRLSIPATYSVCIFSCSLNTHPGVWILPSSPVHRDQRGAIRQRLVADPSVLRKKKKKSDVSHAHIFFSPRFGIRLYFFGLLILFLSLIHEHLYSSQNKLLQNLQRTQVIKAKSALSELIFYYLSQSAPDSRPK